MESLISTFHIDWKILIAQIVNFAIVFAVLYFFALRPLMKTVKERSAKIQQGLDDANTHQELLVETQEESARLVAEARTDALELITAAKQDAETKRNELVEKAQAEVTALLEKGNEQLAQQKEKMMHEVREEIAGLVVAATRTVVGDQSLPVDTDAVAKAITKNA